MDFLFVSSVSVVKNLVPNSRESGNDAVFELMDYLG